MTAAMFLGFVGLIALLVVALIAKYLGGRVAWRVLAGLCVWFLYAGLMAYWGVFRKSDMRPPGVIFLLGPVVLFLSIFLVWVARSSASARVAMSFPLWILLGLQCFRVGVELFLHQLWVEGLVPKMLTFEGANVDIYVGASALVAAWLATRGRIGLQIALVWNLLGLCALANVVSRAVLTTPGPLNLIHAEVPNRMLGMFPFMFIPGFFVPLAVVLHVAALRAIGGRKG